MSRKRSKWKFSPARKRRPVETALSEIPEIDAEEIQEILMEEEASDIEELAVTEKAADIEELAVTEKAADIEEPLMTDLPEESQVGEESVVVAPIELGVEDDLTTNILKESEVEEEVREGLAEEPEVENETEAELAEEPAVEEEPEAVFVEEPAVEEEPETELAEEPEVEEEPEEEHTEELAVEEETEIILPKEPEVGRRSSLDEIYGEETAAAKELPDYYFDEEDVLPDSFGVGWGEQTGAKKSSEEDIFEGEDAYEDADENAEEDTDKTHPGILMDESEDELDDELNKEPQLSLYERGGAGRKNGKKKGSGKNKKDKKRNAEKKVVRVGDVVLGDGIPKICVPITGRGKEQILEQAAAIAQAAPDLAEWRVDYLEEAGGKKDIIDILVSIKEVLEDIPLLFTYRTEGEGGLGRVGWSHYAELLEWAACRPEIDLIDVEATGLDVDTEGLIRVIHGRGTPVIASVHYCGEMPGKKERKEALRFLKQSGGDILKMAFTPQNEEDVLELMTWTRKQSKKLEQPLITMAMGELGRVSRVSGRLTGSAVTFGSVGEGSAPGQIPASELRKILDQV